MLLQVISSGQVKCTERIGKCVIIHTLLMTKTQHKLLEQVLTLNDQLKRHFGLHRTQSVITDYFHPFRENK